MLNALEVDASAVGNHEFDRGIDDLTGRVRDLADFPYLSANVTLDGTPIDHGYELFEIDGITVGVVGAVTERDARRLVDGSGIVGVEFGDPVVAVNAIAARSRDGDAANGEADVIVAEYHEGSQATARARTRRRPTRQAALGASTWPRPAPSATSSRTPPPDVDVIFNGHTHRTYSWLAPVPGGSRAGRAPGRAGRTSTPRTSARWSSPSTAPPGAISSRGSRTSPAPRRRPPTSSPRTRASPR